MKLIIILMALFATLTSTFAASEFLENKSKHQTVLLTEEKVGMPLAEPPEKFQLVHYESPVGELPALISLPEEQTRKHPAIIWLVGGFSNSISDVPWAETSADNDQSASTFWKNGIVTMYPALRGGNNSSGYVESFYGEVDDVRAAFNYLRKLDYVDPHRIYLGGHSTGGTLALLVAESTNKFRAVFAMGPVADPKVYGSDYLVYDTNSDVECILRAPMYWMDSIVSPTFVFEGEDGNSEHLKFLQKMVVEDGIGAPIRFYLIKGHDHFDVIRPLSELIVKEIKQDSGPKTNIRITPREIREVFAAEDSQ